MPKWRMMIFALDVWVKKSWPLPPKQDNFVNFMKPKMSPDWRLFREFLFSRNPLFSQRNLGKKTKIIELGRKLFHTKHQKASERKSLICDCSTVLNSMCPIAKPWLSLREALILSWQLSIITTSDVGLSVSSHFSNTISLCEGSFAQLQCRHRVLLCSLINGSPSTLHIKYR